MSKTVGKDSDVMRRFISDPPSLADRVNFGINAGDSAKNQKSKIQEALNVVDKAFGINDGKKLDSGLNKITGVKHAFNGEGSEGTNGSNTKKQRFVK